MIDPLIQRIDELTTSNDLQFSIIVKYQRLHVWLDEQEWYKFRKEEIARFAESSILSERR